MKRKTLSFINRCLAGVMALLGFQATTGCLVKYGVAPAEYGTPYADFQVQGKVTDTQQESLKDMQVAIEISNNGYSGLRDTLYTNESGEYHWKGSAIPCDSAKVVVNDTTGKYTSDSTKVALSYDRTKADDWYEGVATAEADFELKEKE